MLGQYANLGSVSGDYSDDVGNSTTVGDDDPSHYYGLVQNQPSIEILNLSFYVDGNMVHGSFEIWDNSDPDLPAIGVTSLNGYLESKLGKRYGGSGKYEPLAGECSFDPDAPIVFTDWTSVQVWCTLSAPVDPNADIRLTVEAQIFGRDMTFRFTASDGQGDG